MADMPKKKISELDELTGILMNDYFEVSEPQNNGLSYESKSMSIEQLRNYIFASAFPVGAIYMTSSSSFEPNSVFGGTWERFAQGKTIFGVDGDKSGKSQSYIEQWCTPLAEGGAESMTLDDSTMPQHRHDVNIYTEVDKGAIEFGVRHPYDPNNSFTPSIHVKSGRGAVSARGSSHHWNTGTVCKSQPASDGDQNEKGDSVSIKLPGIQTTTTVNDNGSGNAIPLYPPYITCYIWRRTG